MLDLIPQDLWEAYVPEGQAKALPLNPGAYGDQEPNGSIAVVLPEIPAIIQPFIDGKVKVKAHVMDADGGNEACLEATLNISPN